MSESVSIKVPKLKPLETALELKEATVRDYKRAAERAGQVVDMRQIEALAVHDCQVYDGVRREAAPPRQQTPEEKAEIARIRKEQLAQEQAAIGATAVDKKQLRRRRVKQMHAVSKWNDRWSLAKGRVAQICRGISRHSDIKVATSTCEIPHLAYEIYRIRADFVVRFRKPRPGDEPNPFFGMSDVDAGLLLQRKIEDVCDRSTGKLGPWLVPK